MPTHSPELDNQLSEQTVQHQDVWTAEYTDQGPIGKLTPLGEQLKRQNLPLLNSLVQEGQKAAHDKYPSLYPKVTANWSETNKYRRNNRTIAAPEAQPARTSAKPAAPVTEELETLFGSKSNAGKANALAKADPERYRQLRVKAVEAGLVPSTARDQRIAARRS